MQKRRGKKFIHKLSTGYPQLSKRLEGLANKQSAQKKIKLSTIFELLIILKLYKKK
jgi:hypothetical protein